MVDILKVPGRGDCGLQGPIVSALLPVLHNERAFHLEFVADQEALQDTTDLPGPSEAQ
jgi:hypothetical protein